MSAFIKPTKRPVWNVTNWDMCTLFGPWTLKTATTLMPTAFTWPPVICWAKNGVPVIWVLPRVRFLCFGCFERCFFVRPSCIDKWFLYFFDHDFIFFDNFFFWATNYCVFFYFLANVSSIVFFYRRCHGYFFPAATGGNIEQNGQTHAHSGGIFRHGCDAVKPSHNGQLMCYMFRRLFFIETIVVRNDDCFGGNVADGAIFFF